MTVLRKLTIAELMTYFQGYRDFGQWIQSQIQEHKYFFEVSIGQDDFRQLLVNSSPQNPQPPTPKFWTLQEVLDQIVKNPACLDLCAQGSGGFNGLQVKHYLDQLRSGVPLKKCLIRDIRPGMGQDGSFYVADGKHGLVAYGLWSNLDPEKFPVILYLCTNIDRR